MTNFLFSIKMRNIKYLALLILINYLCTGYTYNKSNGNKAKKSASLHFPNIIYSSRSIITQLPYGSHSTIKQFPFMASLVRIENGLQVAARLVCSVVIIQRYFALSAGHCFEWKRHEIFRGYDYVIHGNSDDWQNLGRNQVMVHDVVKYEIYEPEITVSLIQRYFTANLALIKVHPGFYATNEKPIPIFPPQYPIRVGTIAIFSGWTAVNSMGVANLSSSKTAIANFAECSRYYQTSMEVTLTKKMICAYGFRPKHCIGDSGGPLIYNQHVIGIASFGRECTADHFPDVYTNVQNLTKWIHENMRRMQTLAEFHLDERYIQRYAPKDL